MTTARLRAAVWAGFLALALIALMGASVIPAHAAVSSVGTATVTAYYANPDTGVIEDSGGPDQAALGQSMCEGVTGKTALVEKDTEGRVFVTLRISQGDFIDGYKVAADVERDGTFGDYAASEQTQYFPEVKSASGQIEEQSKKDFRVEVPSENATLRATVYVEPMGRSVVYFIKLSDLKDGNPDGFVARVTPGEGAPDRQQETPAAESPSKADDASVKEGQAAGDKGVKEYSGDGAEVTEESLSKPIPLALILGCVVAVLAGSGALTFGVTKGRRKAQDQAAAAAAAASPTTEAPGASSGSDASSVSPDSRDDQSVR
ncbi:hypothetical protein HLV38_03515 [Berryella wangjianweii]|uniref:Cell surface protein Shp haem-binding domain-containing protein n=1 Tax=Berryella wangjianweii TaxID=2734634 RepID=A0A6M8J2E8_9ACTN|nr:heme-binding Shp domain-containing protein [Berryella wangjianweii]QKF07291.1 hypothetical protein HLV38_03515 [Berryella wangjianweii]